jgi:hypothetical protein
VCPTDGFNISPHTLNVVRILRTRLLLQPPEKFFLDFHRKHPTRLSDRPRESEHICAAPGAEVRDARARLKV